MRYLAIDFETANSLRSSICAFGYALFEDGKIITSGSRLCRPEPNYYDPFNSKIHGITAEDTDSLAGFIDYFSMFDSIEPEFIVAHNASFDISCLRSWCDTVGQPYPESPYVCTVMVYRSLRPEISHSLDSICNLYGITLNHHEAGSDALACGLLLERAFHETQTRTLVDLCQSLHISVGQLMLDDYSPCNTRFTARKRHELHTKISNITYEVDTDTCTSPLCNEHICFTGELTCATRVEAARKAAQRGAIPQDNVTSQTRYLVVGVSDFINFEKGLKSNKLKRAESMIEKGVKLDIITEDEFLDLIKL